MKIESSARQKEEGPRLVMGFVVFRLNRRNTHHAFVSLVEDEVISWQRKKQR